VRPPSQVVAVVGVGAALRLLATVGVQPTIYVDSGEYRDPAFFGGHRRPWTVPMLYELVGDGTARVVIHAVLGAVAWGCLALALVEVLRHPKVQAAAAAVVMALGLVGPVANYDATITSETVAVSLAVLLVAAWVRVAAAPSLARAVAVVAVSVPFAFVRNDHPLLVAATAAIAIALAVRGREQLWYVLLAGLVVVAGWGLYASGRNDEIERFNLALVLGNRVLDEDDDLAWFVDAGMPLPDALGTGDDVTTLDEDPAWSAWAGDEGRTTYTRWLLTHPRHLLFDPWPDVFGVRDTTLEPERRPVVLLAPGDRYGRMHSVVPDAVEQVLWGTTSAAPVVVPAAWLAVAAWRRRRGIAARVGPVRAVGAAAVVLGLGHVLVVWHASTNELGRLAMVAATNVHVGLVVLVAVTLDRRLAVSD
jgi:hypothetical protein